MRRKAYVTLSFLGILSALFLGGCNTVGQQPVVMKPLPPDPGPLCVDSRSDPMGPDECRRRLYAFIQRSIAATVTIGQFAYNNAEGSSGKGGTGVVISPEGLVLTAYHVVRDAEYILATTRYADAVTTNLRVLPVKTVPMEVVDFDVKRDIALLRPKHPTQFPAYLAAATEWQPRPDEFIWHFGRVSVGLRGQLQDWPVNEPQIKVDGLATMKVACRSGDSGGPVVALDGRLVGIVLASVEGEDLTYFLPIGEIMDMLLSAAAPAEAEGPEPLSAPH